MYKIHKLYNNEHLCEILKGVKLAQCMRGNDYKINTVCDLTDFKLDDLTISDSLFCTSCNAKFDDNVQQRQHYKLDWHRYNLKQKLAGLNSLTEESFNQNADEISSISGSESETDEDSESKNETASNTETDIDLKNSSSNLIASRHSKVFFENDAGEIFSIYKCLLHGKKEVPESDDVLVDLLKNIAPNQIWTILMLGGGHFAAGVFKGSEILVHKTFHSYTVRAKQGGSQSARDGKSNTSHPKSAGASLRRYNETTLVQHIQELLESWTAHIKNSNLIFFRAVGPHNRHVLFGGKNPPLDKNDLRLRTVPFATRRATFKEVQRVYDLLSSLEVYGSAEQFKTVFPSSPNKKDKIEVIKKESDESICLGSPRKSRSSPRGGAIDRAKSREFIQRPLPGGELTSDSESDDENLMKIKRKNKKEQPLETHNLEISFTDTLQEFEDTVPDRIKRNRLQNKKPKKKKVKPVVNNIVLLFKKKVWTTCSLNDSQLLENILKTEVDRIETDKLKESTNKQDKSEITEQDLKNILNEVIDDKGNTILHRAAIEGREDIISVLMKYGSDPTTKNKKNQTPYAAAETKEVRRKFRLFLTEFPDKYNYQKSQIPGPIDEEQEKEQAEKKKLLKKAKREKEKIKKKEKFAEQIENEEMQRFASLSDREKRALAAERRILNSKTGSVTRRCFLCGLDIAGKIPFEYNENCFCTITCLKAHRIQNGTILS